MKNLPVEFINRIKKIPDFDVDGYLKALEDAPVKALRFNSCKARPETVEKLVKEWELEKICWCDNGYIYNQSLRPGLSAYHDSGVFYIQEPSAMYPAEAAKISETDIVLDLCASPGGKSTRACEKAKAVISNEIVPSRARVLSSNIERMGFTNDIVCSASPDRLKNLFPEYFSIVIVDAPCSGEGMMRKDDTAIEEWSEANVRMCAERQRTILADAAEMLMPGGRLVYSTCTFEPEENELQVRNFLKTNPDYEFVSERHFYPHTDKGEGQYCCVMIKAGQLPERVESCSEVLSNAESRLSSGGVHILRAGLI